MVLVEGGVMGHAGTGPLHLIRVKPGIYILKQSPVKCRLRIYSMIIHNLVHLLILFLFFIACICVCITATESITP